MDKIINSYIHASSLRSEIRKLKKEALPVDRHQLLSLERLFPTPLPLLLMDEVFFLQNKDDVNRRLVEETGFTNISDWRKKQWGVSADIANIIERKNDANYWMFKCTSLQTPPAEAIKQLSARYPQIAFNIRYFGVDTMVAGEMTYHQGQRHKNNIYQGSTYNNLITRLESKGVVICNEARRLTVKYNSLFKGRTVFDDFELIFGVPFN